MERRNLSEARRAAVEAQLAGPAMPDGGLYLWAWFIDLSNARGAPGMAGPAPITYPDIVAWMQATHRRLTRWEVGVLKGIDVAYLNVYARAAQARRNEAPAGQQNR